MRSARRYKLPRSQKDLHVRTKSQASPHTLIFMQHMLVYIHLYFSRLRSPLFLSPPLSLLLLSPLSHDGFSYLHTTPCFLNYLLQLLVLRTCFTLYKLSNMFDVPDLLSYLIAVCASLGDLLDLLRVYESLTYYCMRS